MRKASTANGLAIATPGRMYSEPVRGPVRARRLSIGQTAVTARGASGTRPTLLSCDWRRHPTAPMVETTLGSPKSVSRLAPSQWRELFVKRERTRRPDQAGSA